MKQGGAPPRQDADRQIQQRHCQAMEAGPVGMQMDQIACLLGRRAVAASAQVRLWFSLQRCNASIMRVSARVPRAQWNPRRL